MKSPNPIVRQIPNALTLVNLLMGCFGIIYTFNHPGTSAIVFIVVGGIFDFADGQVARKLHAQSRIGVELDSLADLATFGILPSFVIYHVLVPLTHSTWLPYTAFSIAIFSAYRLAKFNAEDSQHENFVGLPTPANAFFIAGLALMTGTVGGWLHYAWVLVAIIGILSYLLVSPVEFFSFKKMPRWKTDKRKIVFLVLSLAVIPFFLWGSLAVIMALYILINVLLEIHEYMMSIG